MAIDLSSTRKISVALKKGTITEEQLIAEYGKMRNAVMRQIQRIQKSKIPFPKGKKPRPPTIREISTPFGIDLRSLIREFSEMQRFKRSKSYSIVAREKTRKKTLEILREHGINIKDRQYNKWVRFITWFKASAWAALYDSDSEVVMDVFKEGSNARQWLRLFEEYREE